MAFFLSEAAGNYLDKSTMSLEEASIDLMTTMLDFAELNEAILVADFMLHEQTVMLTEAEKKGKEGGFLSRILKKLKEVASNVKTKISNFFKSIANAIRKFFGKVTSAAKEKGVSTIRIAKGGITAFNEIRGKLEAVHKAVEDEGTAEKRPSEYKEKVAKEVKAFNDTEKKLSDAIANTKQNGQSEEVSLNEISALGKFATDLDNLAKQVEARLDKAVQEATAAEKTANAALLNHTKNAGVQGSKEKLEDDLNEAKLVSAKVKALLSGWQSLASSAGKVNTIVSQAFKVAGGRDYDNEVKAKKEAEKEKK